MTRRIFISAAEVSGDTHAANFARALHQVRPDIEIHGIGGERMAGAGVKIHRETVSNAAMTFHAVKRLGEMWRLLNWTRNFYRQTPIDLHVCVDSSGINLRFARNAKQAGIKVLYYVAPQLWASREGRMKQLRAFVDHVACILPFEEEYFRSHNVPATFVGHPLFDELPHSRPVTPPDSRFPAKPPVIGIVPGSRKSEVRANLPHLLDVANRILAAFPSATFRIPTTSAVHETVQSILLAQRTRGTNQIDLSVDVQLDAFDTLIPGCDLCLVKSGTSTLHVAAWNVPMITVYRVSPLVWHGLGRWVVKTKKIALVNILAGQIEVVPEFVPWYGNNADVAACAIDLLRNPAKLETQRAKLSDLISTLEQPGASLNAAKIAVQLLDGKMT